MRKSGYIFSVEYCRTDYIPRAIFVELDDQLRMFNTRQEAAMQAEKDGIPIIHDLPVEDWTYVDTPRNREIITKALANHPEHNIKRKHQKQEETYYE